MDKDAYDNLTKALAIYRSLVASEHGYIEKKGNEDLFADYQDQGVSEVLNIICHSMQVNIFRGKSGRLYINSEDEGVYAKNESEIKAYFWQQGEPRSDRAYLFYYVTLLLINELFGGNPIRLRRDYLPLGNWIEIIDAAVEKHKELTIEEEMELGFNFIRVGRKWKCFSLDADAVKTKSDTKIGFLDRCILQLKKEDLIDTVTEDEIRIFPTDKLIDLIERGNLNVDRLKELKLNAEEILEN
jgi:hypothetical protein